MNSLLAAKQPPVMKPDIMAFHASSFCLNPFTAQSNVENIPPHTPKLPPVTGARAFIDDIAPTKRSPYVSRQIIENNDQFLTSTTYARRIPGTFDSIPYTTTNSTHGKCSAKITENHPWAVQSV